MKYIFETEDKEEAQAMMHAMEMQVAIQCYWDRLKPVWKHAELTDDQHVVVDKMMEILRDNFEGVLDE